MRNKCGWFLLSVTMLVLFSACKEKVGLPAVQTGEVTVFNDARIAACDGIREPLNEEAAAVASEEKVKKAETTEKGFSGTVKEA